LDGRKGEIKASQVKVILDDELDRGKISSQFPDDFNSGAVSVLQKIFVEVLNFDRATSPFGGVVKPIEVSWNKLAGARDAFLIAEENEFMILYINLEKLTRTAQRFAISSLTRERWARKGEFIAVFHAPNSEVWHLVSPYMSEGRVILRRYIVGEGENHRTVSENLANLDTRLPKPLYDRVQEAFKHKPVTEEFYEDYKRIFGSLKKYLVSKDVDVTSAKKYSHLLLNRLMFIYFIQKKGWIGNNKEFMSWYLRKYKGSRERNGFHPKWLGKLFFEAMSKPPKEKNFRHGFPGEVCEALNNIPFLNGGLFEKQDVDKIGVELPDSIILNVVEDFLENYNFTITEESPFDVDVAIDPAMLGKIYESLIAEEERGKAGIFYTPRVEVDLMCRLALFEYLTKDRSGEIPESLEGSFIREITKPKNRKKIIEFLFTPLEEWSPKLAPNFKPLQRLLKKVKVADPACGSGAFLVGMLQVLLELYEKMGIEPDYNLKGEIINDNLYGADIKDWAVRMAEFRLWLALVEMETKVPAAEPVLPNFTLKLRAGDSIVQKIGGEYIKLEKIKGRLRRKIREDLNKLEELKGEYFKGRKENLKEIRNLQAQILENYIDGKIKVLRDTRRQKQQTTLDGKITEESRKILKETKEQMRELKDTKSKLRKAGSKGVFIWDLDFPEVMLSGGFDVVISNPPYVRQEKIIKQDLGPEELEELPDSQIRKLKEEYKNDLAEYALDRYEMDVGKRCDLYVYFFLKGLELLNPKGNMVFISSNSWLDVDFGKYLQEVVLRESDFEYLIDNQAKRSFEESDVNTVISVMGKKTDEILSGETNFIAFKDPFEDVIGPKTMTGALLGNVEGFREIKIKDETLDVALTDSFRLAKVSHKSLWKLGGGEVKMPQTKLNPVENEKNVFSPFGDYSGGKWGKYIRAPDIFFKILEKGKDLLVPLEEIAEVRFGIKTGANEFFYLTEEGIERWGIERKFWMHKKNGKWVPNYVIRSPRECKSILVDSGDLKYRVLMIHKDKKELKKTNVLKYIRWGEKQGFHKRPTCASRKRWYDLGSHIDDAIMFPERERKKFIVFLNESRVLLNKNLYGISSNRVKPKILCAFLNSSMAAMNAELIGRLPGGGGGPLDLDVQMVDLLSVIDFSKFSELQTKKLEKPFTKLSQRPMGSVFEEIGANSPEEVSLDEVKSDRRRLDQIVMGEILGLSEKEQLEVYRAVIDLVKTRIEKARSV
jgi:hypothetical protein